jgi:hypothetical protein
LNGALAADARALGYTGHGQGEVLRMRKKRKKSLGRHTGLAKHSKEGTRLVPPLAKLPMRMLDFERDLLPEHLWIAALVDIYGIERSHRPFYDLMDALDTIWPEEGTAFGLLTDFGRIPVEARAGFKYDNADLIRAAFHDPIGRQLAFYPDCPAYWLIDQDALSDGGSLDPQTELTRLCNLVVKLLPAKDDFAGHVRVLPFARALKHGKVHFPHDFDLIDVMPRYPRSCSTEEMWRVQSLARTMVNMDYEHSDRYKSKDWPKYFWRHNYDLLPCRSVDLPIRGSRPLATDDAPSVIAALESNATTTRRYLELLATRSRIDLYDPSRDEILLGLFARCVRLFVLMSEDVNLWARDTAGIMLRCLADTAITFCYLARSGTSEEFEQFRRYGEGQEKLLMLHLQDSYPDQQSLEGRTAEAVGNELGSFAPELIQIELGNWAKKDLRKLASKAGLERLYRLIYSPGSSDVHGSWLSLKHSNLRYCAEPMHRFHRLPSYAEPPVYLNAMVAAQELLVACIDAGVTALGFPAQQEPLIKLTDLAEASPTGGDEGFET